MPGARSTVTATEALWSGFCAVCAVAVVCMVVIPTLAGFIARWAA